MCIIGFGRLKARHVSLVPWVEFTWKPGCLEAAQRISELNFAKPGMRVAFYESAKRA